LTKKVLIINEGYSSNLGDQAIKQSMEALFTAIGFNTSFCYFTNPAVQQLPQYDYVKTKNLTAQNGVKAKIKKLGTYFLSFFIYYRYYLNLKKQIRLCLANQHYHMVVIGGGQLINSSKNQRISFFSIALYIWAKAIKKMQIPVYIAGVGVAGKFYSFEKYLYKNALQTTKEIWVRDIFSQQSLFKNFKLQSRIIPDVAFFDTQPKRQYKKNNTALVGIYGYDEYKKSFGMTCLDKYSYYANWKKIIDVFTNEGYQISLFYTTETDAAETFCFKQYLQKQNIDLPVAEVTCLVDLNKVFENASLVYAARMHALILSYKKGCRVEAYEISQKLKSFAEEYIGSGKQPENISKQLYDTFATYFNAIEN